MIIENDHYPGTSPAAAHEALQRLPLADVRKDMAAIFGDADDSPHVVTNRAQPVPKAGVTSPSRTRHGAAAGPIIGATLGGLLLGMTTVGMPELIDRMTPTPHITGPATTVVESPFEATVAKGSTPRATLQRAAAAPAASLAAPTPARRADEARASDDSTPQSPECAGDRLERHWCMRQDILEADRALRRAYAKAINEGVERRFLVAHQRRWTRLRDRATRDPDAVLEGYRELADDLERLAVNGRRQDRI